MIVVVVTEWYMLFHSYDNDDDDEDEDDVRV